MYEWLGEECGVMVRGVLESIWGNDGGELQP